MKVKELKDILARMQDDDEVIVPVRSYTKVYPHDYCRIWGYDIFRNHDSPDELRLEITLREGLYVGERKVKS